MRFPSLHVRRASTERSRTSVRTRTTLLAAALTAGCVSKVSPRPVVNPDRPGYTDGAGIIAAGTSLLTLGYSESRSDDMRVQSIGEATLRIGLHPRVELRLQPNSWVRQRASSSRATGLQDARVGVKASLLAPTAPGWRPAASVVVMSSLPSGAREIGAHAAAQPEVKLVVASQPHSHLGVTANVAYLPSMSSERRGALRSTSLLGSCTLTDRVAMYAEVFATASMDDRRRYHDAGMTIRITNDLQLDGWIGNRSGVRERAAGAGLAVQW